MSSVAAKMAAVIPGGGSDIEYYTPKWLFAAMALEFDLDPASPLSGPVPWIPAKRFYTEADNGLIQEWVGVVWLNSPYGRKHNEVWAAKMHQHCLCGGSGVMITFSRTETDWFQDHVLQADAVLFLNRRVQFVDLTGKPKASGSPGSGSVLAGWGGKAIRAFDKMEFAGYGRMWPNPVQYWRDTN